MVWIEHIRLAVCRLAWLERCETHLVDLSGKGMAASNGVFLHSNAFVLSNGVTYAVAGQNWSQFFQGAAGEDWLNTRNEHIQYRTPTVAGFSLGTSVGEDNYWDVEGRYSGEFNGVRIAARLAYSVNSEFNTWHASSTLPAQGIATAGEQLAGSLSIRHAEGFLQGCGRLRVRRAPMHGCVGFTPLLLPSGVSLATSLVVTCVIRRIHEWTGVSQSVSPRGRGFAPDWGIASCSTSTAAMEFWLAYKNYSWMTGRCQRCEISTRSPLVPGSASDPLLTDVTQRPKGPPQGGPFFLNLRLAVAWANNP